MGSRLCCSQGKSMPAIERSRVAVFLWPSVWVFAVVPRAAAGSDAPRWMHALVGVTLPAYDEKTDAVVLYSETNVTVLSADKIRTQVRKPIRFSGPKGGNTARCRLISIPA